MICLLFCILKYIINIFYNNLAWFRKFVGENDIDDKIHDNFYENKNKRKIEKMKDVNNEKKKRFRYKRRNKNWSNNCDRIDDGKNKYDGKNALEYNFINGRNIGLTHVKIYQIELVSDSICLFVENLKICEFNKKNLSSFASRINSQHYKRKNCIEFNFIDWFFKNCLGERVDHYNLKIDVVLKNKKYKIYVSYVFEDNTNRKIQEIDILSLLLLYNQLNRNNYIPHGKYELLIGKIKIMNLDDTYCHSDLLYFIKKEKKNINLVIQTFNCLFLWKLLKNKFNNELFRKINEIENNGINII